MDKKPLFLSLFLFSGCASLPQKLDPDTIYKTDLKMIVNEVTLEGASVLERDESTVIKIENKDGIDYLSATTCHREEMIKVEKTPVLGLKKKTYDYRFTPIGVEKDEYSCPLQLAALNIKGRHSFGFLDFTHPALKAKAVVHCNGKSKEFVGVSVCESKKGLMQEIIFDTEMTYLDDSNCPNFDNYGNKRFIFATSPGTRVCRFIGRYEPNNVHRLTTIGYDKVILR